MINSFNWSLCCVLALTINLVVSPAARIEAAGMEVESAQPDSPSPTRSVQTSPPKGADILPGSPPSADSEEDVDDSPPSADSEEDVDPVEVPAKRTLADLIGASEISVVADAGGQFTRSIAANQLLKDEVVSHLGETDLPESIRAGRSFSRESLAALAVTEEAKAQTGQALALLLPSVSIHANYGSETSEPSVLINEATATNIPSDSHLRADYGLLVRQTLFDLPTYLDWRRRQVLEQARGETYRVTDGDAFNSVVNSYLSLVSSRLQIDMTRDFEHQLADLLSYIEKRTKAGAASISDLARVRARRQATMSVRLEQESAHAAAGVEFVRLTNVVPRKVRLPVLQDVGASLVPSSYDEAVTTALASNPDIAALTAELKAAEVDRSAAKGRFLPRFDAEYTDSYALHAGGDKSSAGQKDRRIMMVLNWTLFSGGSDYKFYVERSARYRELQYRLDDQRRRVVQALSANYATLATTRDRIASGYRELEAVSIAAEAMSKRMLSGNQSLLDLLDVYDSVYQVRARLVNLHILEMSTVAQLVRLTQGAPRTASEVKAEPAGRDVAEGGTGPAASHGPAPIVTSEEGKRYQERDPA